MEETLTELCQELRNWFDRERYIGHIELTERGDVYCNGSAVPLADNQYFRVIGSVFTDGIHRYPEALHETFEGAVWTMAIPGPVIKLATEIKAWREKNEAPDSPAMSPFTSESFGGYSYSKGSGANGSSVVSWKTAFASRMNAWRKL